MRRTERLLHSALASLIHEKSYDAIAVKEILARADVGRSTFYAHFRGKDELLESGIRDVLRAGEAAASPRGADSAERVLWFSLPMFEHIERYRIAFGSSASAQGHAVVHEHLARVLAEVAGDELARLGRRHQRSTPELPRDVLARHVVSTFLLVLSWWAETEAPLPARTVNDVFRALVLPAVTDAPGP